MQMLFQGDVREMRYLVLMIAAVFLSGCWGETESREIVVRKKLAADITNYRLAHRYALNDRLQDSKQNLVDRWASFVNSEMGDSLFKQYGIRSYPSRETATDLIVESVVRPGRGFPRFGRHFDVITEYIDFLNIRLIDAKTGNLIGEVEYNRAGLAANSPYLVRDMLNALARESSQD